MTFTNNYIFLAYPKTGSTFVREAIKGCGTAFTKRYAILPEIFRPKNLYHVHLVLRVKRSSKTRLSVHGYRSEIGVKTKAERGGFGWYLRRWRKCKKRQIVSCWRDPVERYVSIYRFQQWSLVEGLGREEAMLMNPNFPDLTFSQFMKWRIHVAESELVKMPASKCNLNGLGPQSWQFILHHASKSLKSKLSENWFSDKDELLDLFIEDTKDILFLDQRNLNSELSVLLRNSGFDWNPSLKEKVNVTPENRFFKSSYKISRQDLEMIRRKEDFLYKYWEKRTGSK
jgi:hypothetical protein